MSMNSRWIALPSISFVAALLGACASSTAPSAAADAADPTDAIVITAADTQAVQSTAPLSSDRALLHVRGLSCPLCASNIDVQLKRIDGVENVAVDLGNGTVDLSMKGEPRPSPKALADVIDRAGFTLVKVEAR